MKKLAALIAAIVCAAPAFAGDAGIVKLSLWGKDLAVAVPANTQHITGLDFGIGSDTASISGLQWDFIYAKADEVKGVQAGLVAKHADLSGVQFGLVNFSDRSLTGAQLGYVNLAYGSVTGVQFGLYNQAEEVNGLQLGFVNNVKNINGLQIGIVNMAGNGWFPVMVIVNGRF